MMEITVGSCPEPLERIFRQVEEESERRAEEEHLRSSQMALEKDDTVKKAAKARRRGSVSISRLGQFTMEDVSSVQGSQPPSPSKQFSSLASSSPFFQTQMANASTSSIASGASAFSDDNAHNEDPTQVFQIEQIVKRSSISKIIPRRLSRARSTALVSPTDSIIDVSVHETTVLSLAMDEDGEGEAPSRRASVTALSTSLRSKRSYPSIKAFPSAGSNGNWASKAREFTEKFRRRSKQELTPPIPLSAS